MKPTRSRLLWDRGTPLADAWFEFSTETDRQKIRQSPGFLETITAHAQAVEGLGLDQVLKAFSAASNALTAKGNLERDAKSELLDALYNRDLIAMGFRESPSTSRAPIEFDADVFDDAVVDWRNSTIQFDGKTFGRVRVCNLNSISNAPKKPRLGRPGSGNAIRAAIETLATKSDDFCSLPRKTACERIRSEIGITYDPANGLSDENLAKYIRAKCGIKAIKLNL